MKSLRFGKVLLGLGSPVVVTGLIHYTGVFHRPSYEDSSIQRRIPVDSKTSPALTEDKILSHICDYNGDYSKYFE